MVPVAKAFENRNIEFVVVGNGAYQPTLVDMARQSKSTNIHFFPIQPWEDVPELLAMADVHLVLQKKGAADVVLPSKLTNILSAGGFGVVTADSSTELGKLAAKYEGIFELVPPEENQALIMGIERCLQISANERFNLVARQYAEEFLDRNAIVRRFSESLN